MDIRENVLQKRYFMKDAEGNVIEDWEGLCKRVSKALSNTEEEEKQFLNVIFNCLFLPNTPTLVNAGKKEKLSWSACFSLPIEDSIESIFDAVKTSAIIYKSGGGVGYNFSKLRPKNSLVGSTKGVASGPVSFMTVFDAATEAIKQGGVRRGAAIGILNCDHPDILEFIKCKSIEGKMSNFNISVGITNKFMEDVKNKEPKSLEIWNTIIDRAWENGEPGLVFFDTVNKYNLTPHLGRMEGCNPCGEIFLYPHECCCLGSINLSKTIINGKIDWFLLKEITEIGVVMLDNLIDKQSYPIPKIKETHKGNRKIGLGIMGWADMLIKLKISYNSKEALDLSEKVMQYISETAQKQSEKLAEEKEVFPNWEGSIWHQKEIKIRNATLTTVAPTGSLSIIAECSSGIEPNFDWITIQKRIDGEFEVTHPLYAEWKGKKLPDYFITSKEIPYEQHIRMQATFQKYVSNSISKTINFPNSATKQDVEKAYMLAYELECKGITIYRDGSRKTQVISTKDSTTVPDVLDAKRVRIESSAGNVYLTISMNPDPVELFITIPDESKFGGEIYDAFARIFSLSLRYKIPINELLVQLDKANRKYGSVASIPSAIIRAFRMLNINGTIEKCPDCGGELRTEEGCQKCICGYTRC